MAHVLVVLLLLVGGCQSKEEIRVAESERESPPRQEFDAEAARSRLDHMFAAIVPHGEKAWFFKVVAPAAQAEEAGQAFEDFVATISLDSVPQDATTPNWQLPDGWKQQPGSGMRDATLEMPLGESTLELAVSSLPTGGDWSELLTANVNRWLNQLSQAPLDAETVAELVRQQPIDGGEATLVELVGAFSAPDMSGRLSGALPASHPPVESPASPQDEPAAASRQVASGEGFSIKAPEGWTDGRPSSMRKASFAAEGGVDVSVTSFDNRLKMGDLGFNLQRWAAEVELDASQPDELIEQAEEITVGGADGHLIELTGPERSTRAAMIPRGDQVWFFKITGPADAVERESDAFSQLLDSVQFERE